MLKSFAVRAVAAAVGQVSVLFNEPKLLKSAFHVGDRGDGTRFSALQRAEIAEIPFVEIEAGS